MQKASKPSYSLCIFIDNKTNTKLRPNSINILIVVKNENYTG